MDSWLELACKTVVLKGIVDKLPDSVPSIRELRIQAAKLNRMLMSPPWKDGPPPTSKSGALALALSGTNKVSVKKYKKAKGRYAVKVGEQAKKLEKMADQSFKQWFRQTKQLMTNAEFQKWKVKLNGAISTRSAEIQKQVAAGVLTGLTKGSGKLFGKIGQRS